MDIQREIDSIVQERRAAFGRHLKFRRIRAGLTKTELSRRVGANPSTVYNWEHGHSGITLDSVFRLAAVLGCSVASMVDGDVAEAFEEAKGPLVERVRALEKAVFGLPAKVDAETVNDAIKKNLQENRSKP